MIISIILALFKTKFHPNMSELEKKWQGIYDLLKAETKSKLLCLPHTKQGIFLQKDNF